MNPNKPPPEQVSPPDILVGMYNIITTAYGTAAGDKFMYLFFLHPAHLQYSRPETSIRNLSDFDQVHLINTFLHKELLKVNGTIGIREWLCDIDDVSAYLRIFKNNWLVPLYGALLS